MAKKPGSGPQAMKARASKTAAAIAPGSALASRAEQPKKKKSSPVQFAKEVRAEARKISWTSRKETWITAVMVFVMVIVASIFFLVVDYTLGFSMRALLNNLSA